MPEIDPELLKLFMPGDPGPIVNMRPAFDPVSQRHATEETRAGRDPTPYTKVLEHYGFQKGWNDVFQEVQWRHDKLRMAFSADDLFAQFAGGPPDLDRWLKEVFLRKRLEKMLKAKPEIREAVKWQRQQTRLR